MARFRVVGIAVLSVPREVMAHGNKVPGGPNSEELARVFEMIFRDYPEGVGDRVRDDSAV